jgi:hypothetical protein
MSKASAATEIDDQLEVEIRKNIHEWKRPVAPFRHLDNADDEMSANYLGTLLRRVTETSTREVDNLIDELLGLRKTLETDRDRIQSEIARHSELNQGVIQLTSIISENVKKLPNPAY